MGLFDFNRDGKTDFSEHFLAYGIFQAVMNSRESSNHFHDDYGWRDFCEDGFEYDVDPEDYDTEEEYMEALNKEKYGWRETCEDGFDYGVDPEDYETEEEYMEMLKEEKYGWREVCEDGSEYGVYPEDYETEEEYMEALEDERDY